MQCKFEAVGCRQSVSWCTEALLHCGVPVRNAQVEQHRGQAAFSRAHLSALRVRFLYPLHSATLPWYNGLS